MSTTKQSLFEITDDLIALNDLLEEIGGDLSDPKAESAIAEWMAQLGEAREKKLESYGYLIRKLEMEAAAATEEKERFAAKARSRVNRRVYLLARLKLHMETIGERKIETPAFTFGIQANGGKQAVTIYDEMAIPPAYTKTVTMPDNEMIRSMLEAGEEVPGAKLEPRGTSLRIR